MSQQCLPTLRRFAARRSPPFGIGADWRLLGWLVGSVDTHEAGGLKMNLMSHWEGALWWLSSELGGDFPGRMLQPRRGGWLAGWLGGGLNARPVSTTSGAVFWSNGKEIHVWMQWTVAPSVAHWGKSLFEFDVTKKEITQLTENLQRSALNRHIGKNQSINLFLSSKYFQRFTDFYCAPRRRKMILNEKADKQELSQSRLFGFT